MWFVFDSKCCVAMDTFAVVCYIVCYGLIIGGLYLICYIYRVEMRSTEPEYMGYTRVNGCNVLFKEGGPSFSIQKAMQKKHRTFDPMRCGSICVFNGVVVIDGVELRPEDFKDCAL